MAKIRGKITLYNRAGLRDNIPCQYIFDETPFYETQKISDKSQSEAISEINKNLSNAIAQLQNQIETITGTKPDNIYRVVYDVDWSRIKADHNDYTNGVNHFEIIDKQDNEVLWAEVYCNNIGSGNQPCNNFYSYQVDNGIINEHRFWEDGNLNVPLGYNWRGGGTEGSISNTYIFTVKVRAAKILKFIDPVMEKALSAYYANTVTNVAGYGLVHVDNKLLDVEAEKITSLDSRLHTRTGISDIWHDLKTTEDFKLLPNLTAFNGSIIAASSNYITDLDTLYIPKSVKEINGFLISYIPDFTLKHIVVEEGNPVFDSRDNCDCLIRTADNAMIGGCMNSKIPASVTTVDGWWYGKGIKRLSLPDTLTSWPSSNNDGGPAHYKTFPDLEYLRLSAGIKEYLGNVSRNNPNLKELIIPEGIEVINSGDVLISSGKVTQLEIPSTITTIASPAFYSQGSVKKVIFHCIYSNATWNWGPYIGEEYVFDNDVIFPDNYSGQFIPNNLKKLTFTDNCTIIPKNLASRSNYHIEELNFGKGLTEIPDYAFSGTLLITELNLPNNIKTIGTANFASSSYLTKINAPGIETIKDYAFSGVASVYEYINIPNIISIGNNVFYGGNMQNVILNCPKLKTIGNSCFENFNGKLIALNVESIGQGTFNYGGSGDNGSVITIGGQAKFINGSGQESSGTSHIGGQLIIKGDSCDYRNTMLNVYAIRLHCTGEAKISDIYAYTKLELNSGSVTINNSQTNRFSYLIVPSVSHYAVTTTLKDDSSLYGNDYKHIYTDYECTNSVGNFVIEPEGDNTEIKPYVFQLTNIKDANTDDKYLIDIKSGITKIGAKAFYHLLMASNKPVEIYIPASVTEIGEKAFEGVPTSNQEGTYYFYGAPPTGVVGGIQKGYGSGYVTVKVKQEYLEQWQAVEWQGDVTIEVMDE